MSRTAIVAGRGRLTIERIMLGIAILAMPVAIASRHPRAGAIVALYVLWFGVIRGLIRLKRRQLEPERWGSSLLE